MHRSAWKFMYGILSDRWSFKGDTIIFLVLLWNIDFFCTQFHWKRTCDANMRDNNFFANKNIGVRHENLADNNCFAPTHSRAARKPGAKLWPAVNDWRTHFALFILQIIHISFNIHNSSENTNNFVTSNKLYSTTECNTQIIHNFLPSHLYVSVLLTIQYFNYVLSGSIICVAQLPPGTNSLA